MERPAIPAADRFPDTRPAVDVVIPVYGERSEALAATLSACLTQTHAVARIFVVDDGSPDPISLPEWAHRSPQIRLVRLPQNQGISAARNAAMALSDAPFVACINTEVLPDSDWVEACLNYLAGHPGVGACATRVVPIRPDRILTRWRMRFQEPKYPEQSGPTPFAHGHAVLFRKEAVSLVGHYDVRYRRNHEDWDICRRMRQAGWDSHFVASSRCVSIQQDSLDVLANKQLRDSGWYSPREGSLMRLYFHLTMWTMVRAGRNVLNGRLYFLPVDVSIWARGLWTATYRTLDFRRTSTGQTSKKSVNG